MTANSLVWDWGECPEASSRRAAAQRSPLEPERVEQPVFTQTDSDVFPSDMNCLACCTVSWFTSSSVVNGDEDETVEPLLEINVNHLQSDTGFIYKLFHSGLLLNAVFSKLDFLATLKPLVSDCGAIFMILPSQWPRLCLHHVEMGLHPPACPALLFYCVAFNVWFSRFTLKSVSFHIRPTEAIWFSVTREETKMIRMFTRASVQVDRCFKSAISHTGQRQLIVESRFQDVKHWRCSAGKPSVLFVQNDWRLLKCRLFCFSSECVLQ